MTGTAGGAEREAQLAVAESQRRAAVRVQAVRPVRVPGPGEDIVAHTINISGTGLLLTACEHFAVGNKFAFTLELGDDHPDVTGNASVVRETEEGHLAVRIDSIDASERERLIRFVFDRQRLDAKHGRLP